MTLQIGQVFCPLVANNQFKSNYEPGASIQTVCTNIYCVGFTVVCIFLNEIFSVVYNKINTCWCWKWFADFLNFLFYTTKLLNLSPTK